MHLRRRSWIVGSGPRRPDCRDDPHRDDLEDLSFSLEIPGNRLDWRKDRMMVLDCSTACGDPDGLPTELITKPRFRSLEYPSVETFNNFVAYASTVVVVFAAVATTAACEMGGRRGIYSKMPLRLLHGGNRGTLL